MNIRTIFLYYNALKQDRNNIFVMRNVLSQIKIITDLVLPAQEKRSQGADKSFA